MGKCTCTIRAGSPFAGVAPPADPADIRWPAICAECKEKIETPEEAGTISDFNSDASPNAGINAICKTCLEIIKCFFCSCKLGTSWEALRYQYNTIGLGNLTELLSPEAKAVLIEKVDQWFLEDNANE